MGPASPAAAASVLPQERGVDAGPAGRRAASAPCGGSRPHPHSCPNPAICTSALLNQSTLFPVFPHLRRLFCCFWVRAHLGGACCLHPHCTDSFPSCFWKAVLSLFPLPCLGVGWFWVQPGAPGHVAVPAPGSPSAAAPGQSRGTAAVQAPDLRPALPGWMLLPGI